MYDYIVEILKSLGIEACKWGAVALLSWLGFRFRPIKITIAKVGIPRSTILTIVIAVAASGFLNSAITILYNHYQFAQLSNWGQEASDPPKDININGGYGPITATC